MHLKNCVIGSSALRVWTNRKYATSWAHFGHRLRVVSTFFHASSPPKTSSTRFLCRIGTSVFDQNVPRIAYEYGQVLHDKRNPPSGSPPSPSSVSPTTTASSNSEKKSSLACVSMASMLPQVGQNVNMVVVVVVVVVFFPPPPSPTPSPTSPLPSRLHLPESMMMMVMMSSSSFSKVVSAFSRREREKKEGGFCTLA